MEIRGPCFVILKNGQPFNKYEVLARTNTPKGIQNTKYYFDSYEDAELYMKYLYQQEGEKSLYGLLSSDRTYKWEKREYMQFMDSIDWDELPKKVKNLKFTTETVFLEIRKMK